MKSIVMSLAVFLIGISIGIFGAWVSSYSLTRENLKESFRVEDLLQYSDVKIDPKNFICDNNTSKDVGSVVGSIIDLNIKDFRNKISIRCYENVCVLNFSNCQPWQKDSCGGRSLSFKLDEESKIVPSTFTCIDAP